MPGTAINQINYGSKANQQTSNDIDGILNEVQKIDRSAGQQQGQYNSGPTNPTVQVNPVPKQFQYDPTPPQSLPIAPPPMQQQMQMMQVPQMEAFQGGPSLPIQQAPSGESSWEWMRSMKLTFVMLLLLALFFNPFVTAAWKKIPFIEQNPMLAKVLSGICFMLSFYLISLFI